MAGHWRGGDNTIQLDRLQWLCMNYYVPIRPAMGRTGTYLHQSLPRRFSSLGRLTIGFLVNQVQAYLTTQKASPGGMAVTLASFFIFVPRNECAQSRAEYGPRGSLWGSIELASRELRDKSPGNQYAVFRAISTSTPDSRSYSSHFGSQHRNCV